MFLDCGLIMRLEKELDTCSVGRHIYKCLRFREETAPLFVTIKSLGPNVFV